MYENKNIENIIIMRYIQNTIHAKYYSRHKKK